MDIYGKIDAAQARIREGQAPRRIPVDSCDVDIVLYECEREIRHLRAENKALKVLARCGCGDHFTPDNPGECVNCVTALRDAISHHVAICAEQEGEIERLKAKVETWEVKYEVLYAEAIPRFARLERLADENEALRKDAERYQWLRTLHLGYTSAPSWDAVLLIPTASAEHTTLDQLVDAALAAKGDV